MIESPDPTGPFGMSRMQRVVVGSGVRLPPQNENLFNKLQDKT